MQELSELTTLGYFNKMQTHRLGTSLARLTRMDSGTGPKRVVGSGLDKIRAECRSAFPIFFLYREEECIFCKYVPFFGDMFWI